MPIEDYKEGDEGMVGKVNLSLYGTRDASANWQEEVAMCMREWDFKVGKFNPCMYHHPAKQIRCLVHGDGFASVGDPGDLK